MANEEQVINYENAGRLVISAIAYPIENAKTLIQVRSYPVLLIYFTFH